MKTSEGNSSKSAERSILFLCDDWGLFKNGIVSINRRLAINLARFKNVKVYSTVVQPITSLTITDLEDAEKNNVTLVGPQGGNGTNPGLTGLNENIEEYFAHIQELLPDVTHIVGHGPITAAAAVKFRDLFYNNSKIILFYHVIPRDIDWLNGSLSYEVPTDADMVRWAEEADVVYSVTDKIHWFYNTRFRNRAKVQIDHRLYLPLCDEFFSVNRKESTISEGKVLAFGNGNGTASWEGCDISACFTSKTSKALNQASKAVDEQCESSNKDKLSLIVGGASKEKENDIKEAIDVYLKDQETLLDFSEYTDSSQLMKDFECSSLCVVPSRAEPYGYHGLEALCAGIPTLLAEDSSLGTLIRRLTADPEYYLVPVTADVSAIRQDSSVWRDRGVVLLQNPSNTHDQALQLRESLRKDDTIKETNDNFVSYCLGGIKIKLEATKVEFVRTRDEETKEIPTLNALNKFILYTLKQCWRLKHDPLTRKEDLLPVVPGIEIPLEKIVTDVIDFIEEHDRRIVGIDSESSSFVVYCPNAEALGNLWAMCDRINRALYNNLVSEDERQVLDRFKLARLSTRGVISGPEFLTYTRELSKIC